MLFDWTTIFLEVEGKIPPKKQSHGITFCSDSPPTTPQLQNTHFCLFTFSSSSLPGPHIWEVIIMVSVNLATWVSAWIFFSTPSIKRCAVFKLFCIPLCYSWPFSGFSIPLWNFSETQLHCIWGGGGRKCPPTVLPCWAEGQVLIWGGGGGGLLLYLFIHCTWYLTFRYLELPQGGLHTNKTKRRSIHHKSLKQFSFWLGFGPG